MRILWRVDGRRVFGIRLDTRPCHAIGACEVKPLRGSGSVSLRWQGRRLLSSAVVIPSPLRLRSDVPWSLREQVRGRTRAWKGVRRALTETLEITILARAWLLALIADPC